MDAKSPGGAVGRGYPDSFAVKPCRESSEMAIRPEKRSLRYEILTLIAAVLVGVTQLDAAAPTTRAAKPLDARELLARALSATVQVRTYLPTGKAAAIGPGFLIDAEGTVVTNYRVMKDAASARVFVQAGLGLPAVKIIALDEQADVAIIKVEGKGLPFLPLRTTTPKVGEKVHALVSSPDRKITLGDGLVTGLRRKGGATLILLSGPISRGPSGRALLDTGGRLLGLGIATSGIFKGEKPGLIVASEKIARLIKGAASSTQTMPKLVPPAARAVVAPKIYNSLRALLSEVPRELVGRADRPLSPSQSNAITAWFGKNIPRGSMLVVSGSFTKASKDSGRITLNFKYTAASIHGKKITMRATAYLGREFAEKVKTLTPGKPAKYLTLAGTRRLVERGKPGTPITVHGKIVRLVVAKDELFVRLTDCGFGKIPPPKRPTATTTTKPKPKPKPKSPEKKAAGKLKLANLYLEAGKKAKAIEILKGIVADYPGTDAAKAAASKLKEF